MRILVALKWVPLRPEVDPLTGAASTDERFSGASPADSSALEWGLRLADATGGSVLVATLGPPEADAVLRPALAAGATGAIRIDSSTSVPSRWVGAELAAVAVHCDLVLCGHASLDRGTGAVPAFIAHELGWPQALGVVSLALDDSEALILDRRLDGGRRERLALRDAGVVSVESGPELRRAPLTSTLTAGSALVEVRTPARPAPDDATIIDRRPYRPRSRVAPPPAGPTRDRIGQLLGVHEPSHATSSPTTIIDPSEAARLMMERLRQWGYLEA